MASLSEITSLYQRQLAADSDRDRAMREVTQVRAGQMSRLFPDLFPEEGPLADKALAANMVDVAARDTAEVLAPLPTINCSGNTAAVSDTARKFGEKRTKIANNYLQHSEAQRQMYNSADGYVTYGFSVGIVEPDWDNQMPYIRFVDSTGCHYVKDRFNRVTAFFQQMWHDVDTLCAMYPVLESHIRTRAGVQNTRVELIRYQDKHHDVLFMWQGGGLELQRLENPLGEVLVVPVERPGLNGMVRGQFDDVLAVQVAKARFGLLAMEAAVKAVQAPIALPQDVQELSIGADATLRSASPEKIRRIGLDVPRETFMEQQQLDQELRSGSRYPDARGGNVEGSIVTGRGVQALMSGFDTQIRTGQAMYALAFQKLLELCFKMDEALWPNVEKDIRGNDNGTPYQLKYKPSRDIKSDFSVDVQYGLMAGLDPNRALVFGLQARGDKLISREFLQSQMPFSIDPTQESQRVDKEDLRDALKQAVAGYAQAIPVLAQQGQDPGEILARMAQIIQGRQKGDALEDVIAEAFAPAEPPPGAVQPDGSASPDSGAPGLAAPGAGAPPGMQESGLLPGVASGQAGMAPGGRPDLQTLMAQIGANGQPNLTAGVTRRLPI
jgi:hypothetical protein